MFQAAVHSAYLAWKPSSIAMSADLLNSYGSCGTVPSNALLRVLTGGGGGASMPVTSYWCAQNA